MEPIRRHEPNAGFDEPHERFQELPGQLGLALDVDAEQLLGSTERTASEFELLENDLLASRRPPSNTVALVAPVGAAIDQFGRCLLDRFARAGLRTQAGSLIEVPTAAALLEPPEFPASDKPTCIIYTRPNPSGPVPLGLEYRWWLERTDPEAPIGILHAVDDAEWENLRASVPRVSGLVDHVFHLDAPSRDEVAAMVVATVRPLLGGDTDLLRELVLVAERSFRLSGVLLADYLAQQIAGATRRGGDLEGLLRQLSNAAGDPLIAEPMTDGRFAGYL